ncbi:MAG: hypothetical protein EOL97_14955 [Spirochaetia bacterium]|nr:hypothetical protein [Spirochaetia bacterium]
MEINLEEILEPTCFENECISPTLKNKDGELYCSHYELDFCYYRNDKNRLKMYCNYYKHISYVVGLEFGGNDKL